MIGNKKKLTHKFKVVYDITDGGNTITATVTPTISPLTSKPSFCGVAKYNGHGTFSYEMGKTIARKKAIRRYWRWLKNVTRLTKQCLIKDINDLYDMERHCNYMIRMIDKEIKTMVEE